jgi:hypothetical protein
MTVYDPPSSHAQAGVPIGVVLHDKAHGLHWKLLAGKNGLDRLITHPRVQKSGLALVGHLHGLVSTRVQVVGETELSYVESLDEAAQRVAADHLFSARPSCVFVSRGAEVPTPFIQAAEAADSPLVLIEEKSSVAIMAIHTVLDEHLAPRTRLHGVLVDIFEVGVLLSGQSGIGKSECALELVMRGHRLVADDIVECDYRPPGMVFGEPADPAPVLGAGSSYRAMSGKVLESPRTVFEKLRRWNELSFLKTPKNMEMLLGYARDALEPEKLRALIHLVEHNLGYRLYRAVEAAKIELSHAPTSTLDFVDDDVRLQVPLSRADFEAWIAPELERLAACVDELFAASGVAQTSVDAVFLTGGTGQVPAVRQLFAERFGEARLRTGSYLTSIASGLALHAARVRSPD